MKEFPMIEDLSDASNSIKQRHKTYNAVQAGMNADDPETSGDDTNYDMHESIEFHTARGSSVRNRDSKMSINR